MKSLSFCSRFAVRGLLVSCLLLLCSHPMVAQKQSQTTKAGRYAVPDSVIDAGGGMMTVSWSLSPVKPNEKYLHDYPEKVCVVWWRADDDTASETAEECFTEGLATQSDLTVDTELDADAPSTEFTITLLSYFNGILDGATRKYLNVTMNGSS